MEQLKELLEETKNKKNEDYKYIKKFTKISLFKICDLVGVNYYNLLKGKSSAEATETVRKALEKEIKKL